MVAGAPKPRSYGVVLASLIVAFMLAAVPLPDWVNAWRPAWVAMVLIYWCIALPERVGVGTAWIVGLFLDGLTGSLLGLHAAGLAIVAYIAASVHQRIRLFPLGQQALLVGVILAVYLSFTLWVRFVQGTSGPNPTMLLPAVSSMLLWPWLFIILRDLRRKFRVT